MKLERVTWNSPSGLRKLLADLADGESGFVGTPVHAGKATLEKYLQQCCEMTDPAKL